MVLNVAIVGMADIGRDAAPYDQPDWEIWGLAWDHLPRMTEAYDPHIRVRWALQVPKRLERYKHLPLPLYMQEAHNDLPTSIAYPLEEVGDLVGRNAEGKPYIESTVAYMLGRALLKGAERIGIYGVEMASTGEWAYQRPNMEYLIGFARGRGVKVFLPRGTCVLTSAWESGIYGFMDAKPDAHPALRAAAAA